MVQTIDGPNTCGYPEPRVLYARITPSSRLQLGGRQILREAACRTPSEQHQLRLTPQNLKALGDQRDRDGLHNRRVADPTASDPHERTVSSVPHSPSSSSLAPDDCPKPRCASISSIRISPLSGSLSSASASVGRSCGQAMEFSGLEHLVGSRRKARTSKVDRRRRRRKSTKFRGHRAKVSSASTMV